MLDVRQRIVTDEANHPIAVQIDYEDWCRIEQALNLRLADRPATDLGRHIGKLHWPMDGLAYQQQVRSEWDHQRNG